MKTIVKVVLMGIFGLCAAGCEILEEEEIFQNAVNAQSEARKYSAIDDHDVCKGGC